LDNAEIFFMEFFDAKKNMFFIRAHFLELGVSESTILMGNNHRFLWMDRIHSFDPQNRKRHVFNNGDRHYSC
jgi:hypothetical protein